MRLLKKQFSLIKRKLSQLLKYKHQQMYYSKRISNFNQLLAPIYTLLIKGSNYDWDESCAKAFKKCITVIMWERIALINQLKKTILKK